MDLLVIRHGIATERVEGEDDTLRPLTGRGRKRFKQVARGLDRLGLVVDRVLHSPWVRAAQTAALLDRIVEGELADPMVATAHLAGPPRAELFRDLAGLGVPRVAVVGHEPWLGELVALLTLGASNLAALAFRKGGVAILSGTATPGGMQLQAFLPPKILRSVR